MVRTVLIGVVLVLSGAMGATAAPDSPPDLAGMYQCDGMNPDGTAYHGTVEIRKLRDTFRVEWTMDDGVMVGVGIYSGGVFAASYFGGAPAVVVYKVDGNRLVGEWTMGGIEGAVYPETLTKMPSTGVQKPPSPPRRQQPDRQAAPTRGIPL